MLGPLMVCALLAPAPADPEPAAATPVQRDYEGPIGLEAAPNAQTPTVAGDAAADEPDVTTTETQAGISSEAPSPGASPFAPVEKRRPVPRLLSTIEDYPIDEQAHIGKRIKFYPGIQVRNQIGWVSAFPIDRFGNEYAEGGFSTGRIRWNPKLDIRKKLKLVGTVDLVNGRWAPSGSEDPIIQEIIDPSDDTVAQGQPPVRADLPIVDFRELYLEWRFSLGLVRLGQQAFTWGSGMLANSGNYNDRFGDMRFGDDEPGSIYERLLFATKPFQYRPGKIKDLVVAVGGDLIYRDSRVDIYNGDLGGQALMVLRYQPEDQPGNWVGGYGVYRNEHLADDGDIYEDDTETQVGVVDVGGQGTLWLRDDLQLMGSFETAIIFGGTKAAWDREDRRSHKVLQGGAVGRAYVGNHHTWLVGFDTGYASGDADPTDEWINNFTFADGHNVGLLMFEHILGWRTARSEILATDGSLINEPLNGTQYLPTRGRVTNAVYIQPMARYALWERLEFWGGPLFAAAPVPVVDPYATRVNGGVPANSLLGDGGKRFYGTEIDLGIRGRFDIRNFWLQAGLQGAVLFPGQALADRGGDTGGPAGGIWFRTEIRY